MSQGEKQRDGAGRVRRQRRAEAGPGSRPGPGPGPPRQRSAAACGALLLTLSSVPLAYRAADTDGPTPVPQLLAFLPWFLVPGWLALVCAVLSRRPLLALWAVAVLTGTAWFLQPYGPDAPDGAAQRPAEARFHVLTANLEFGAATEGLLDVLRSERPQIVSLQECDSGCAAALRRPAVRRLYPYRVVAGGSPAEGSTAEGSALLSTYPLRRDGSVDGALSMPGAVADVHGTPVRLQVAHPMPPRPESMDAWSTELGRLRAFAAARGSQPTVIAGDFNSSQDHAAFRSVLDTGMRDAARQAGHSRTPTWPARTAPPLGAQIDHVLLSSRLTAVGSRFLDLPDTDHRALLAEVRLFGKGRGTGGDAGNGRGGNG